MHLSAQYLCDLENHLKTALQYGLLMGVHRHDIFFSPYATGVTESFV